MTDLDQAIRARLDADQQLRVAAPEESIIAAQRYAAVVRAVLDLHAPYVFYEDTASGIRSCASCCDEDGDPVLWPCPTVVALARGLGVPDPKETT